ncbi:DNA adenine methylase [Pantoea agglomerans]|uniref:DNA adenine methylase n=1 Tax=Enterobacter agglomerans TaxID=549 RepID=UPI003C7B5823
MYSNKLYTPLRYPGGKATFAPYIAEIISSNDLVGGHYLEPYAGGAGVALELLFHNYVDHIHINDIDPAIYAFWVCITKHTHAILELLDATPITIEEWYKWRDILQGKTESSFIEKGFATLFLNRTNRSGILKAGVIGGKEQKGNYKLDARFKKDVIAARINKVASFSERISVYCEDSLSLLQKSSDFLPKSSLIYLDPPYYVKGKGLYRNYYEHNDHLEIAKELQSKDFPFPWIVSYDNVPEICSMYQNSKNLNYDLNYTAQKRYVGNEVMFFSPKIINAKIKIPNKKTA